MGLGADMPGNTQEMILDQLRNHGQELSGIRDDLKQLIRVEEKQNAADARIEFMLKECSDHDQRIDVLEKSDTKKSVLWPVIEKGVIWAALFGLAAYVTGK